ncbi:MAG: response regulator [Bradyrhizobium sp.]|nr:response regulator [Bradyrhizobium sp.]
MNQTALYSVGGDLMMPLPANPTIYVVDDDADVLGSLRFLLESDGFNVRTFRNGSALLNAARSTGVDCFVIDYKMPDMNGIELAKRLRSRDMAAPIILITGYPDENIAARAVAAGVRDVLLKPLLDESLVTRIRRAIQDGQAAAGPGH